MRECKSSKKLHNGLYWTNLTWNIWKVNQDRVWWLSHEPFENATRMSFAYQQASVVFIMAERVKLLNYMPPLKDLEVVTWFCPLFPLPFHVETVRIVRHLVSLLQSLPVFLNDTCVWGMNLFIETENIYSNLWKCDFDHCGDMLSSEMY